MAEQLTIESRSNTGAPWALLLGVGIVGCGLVFPTWRLLTYDTEIAWPVERPAHVAVASLIDAHGCEVVMKQLEPRASAARDASLLNLAGVCHARLEQPERAATAFKLAAELNQPGSLLAATNLRLLETALISNEYLVALDLGSPRALPELGLLEPPPGADRSRNIEAVEVTPTTTLTPDEAVRVAVSRWLTAWQRGNLADYFDAYEPNYRGVYRAHSEWRSARERIIKRAGNIRITLDAPPRVDFVGGTALVSLQFFYRSDNHEDITRKQLHMKLDNRGEWKIFREVTVEVDRPL